MQSEEGGNWDASSFGIAENGKYFHLGVQESWAVWQASALNTEAHLMQSHEGLMDAASAKHHIAKAEADRDHWKHNHDNMVSRCALLSQRPDLPVDRIPAYQELAKLQELIDRNARVAAYMARTREQFSASLKVDMGNGAMAGPVKSALQELTEQAQELDMGYGPNACPTCGKSKP